MICLLKDSRSIDRRSKFAKYVQIFHLQIIGLYLEKISSTIEAQLCRRRSKAKGQS
jgi:hypothetical protein